MPDRFARVVSGKHGHDRGDAQFDQSIRMRGVVGREVQRETGLDGLCYQAPVLDSDIMVAKDGLVGEGNCVLAGVGGDELNRGARRRSWRRIRGDLIAEMIFRTTLLKPWWTRTNGITKLIRVCIRVFSFRSRTLLTPQPRYTAV